MASTLCPADVTISYNIDDGFGGGSGYASPDGAVFRIERIVVEGESDLVHWLDKTEFWQRAARIELRFKNGQTIVADKLGSTDEAKGSVPTRG